MYHTSTQLQDSLNINVIVAELLNAVSCLINACNALSSPYPPQTWTQFQTPQPEYHQHVPHQEPASPIRFQNPDTSTSTGAISDELPSLVKTADTSLHSDNIIYDPPINELDYAAAWENLNHRYYQQCCLITDEFFDPFFEFLEKVS